MYQRRPIMEFLFKTYALVVGFVAVVTLTFYIAMFVALLTLNAIRRAIRMMSRLLQRGSPRWE
jgi:hypothetical protein